MRTPFSCVLCAGLLERCDSPRRILERLHRAVKPGGIVVIVFGWFWDLGVFPQKDSEHGTEVQRLLMGFRMHACLHISTHCLSGVFLEELRARQQRCRAFK